MSSGDDGSEDGFGARLGMGLLVLAGLAVVLAYVDRIFLDLPLYPGDEGAYLIHGLYGKAVAADPKLSPDLQGLNNTAFLLIIRAVTYGTHNLIEWLRALGATAYFAGILLVWLGVRGRLSSREALGFLLLAAAFPYYRFVFAIMPEGWYVGLLGLIILATIKLYLSHPVTHALVAGALAGVLVLLKPHGLAVIAAFPILALLDLAWGRRELTSFVARVVIFALAFVAAGNLVALLAGEPITRPFTFFVGDHYAKALTSETTPASLIVALRALALLVASSLLLAGVPILTGLLRLGMRWNWSRGRGRFDLEPQEIAFLLVLLSFGATLAMTAIFTMKALVYGPTEANRLWGRYFEFFIPMIWLTAAPFVLEFERGGGRWWRIVAGVVPLAGLAGLIVFVRGGIFLFPWDATALTAFFRPDPAKFGMIPLVPYFAIAVGATLAACAATGSTNWRAHRIWLAYFVLLGVLSTALDRAWERDGWPAREALNTELHVAELLVSQESGLLAAIVDDLNAGHTTFWRLQARPHMILVAPDADVADQALAAYDTVIVVGPHDLVGDGWKPLFLGQRLAVFRREAALATRARLGLETGTR
ncbi:MAG: hypothetical protein Q8Q88_15015 [Phenylobacterium sp.]|uniref:hypothetical protein n=1 Tax=Phenylobacterium sp. TaxID=1871053 RepID=UPI002736816D|nr:hypothetical protein [Phenylobacterium sp.]MDP3748348.1 hypothetical protein [Phenylobacterium sp.]